MPDLTEARNSRPASRQWAQLATTFIFALFVQFSAIGGAWAQSEPLYKLGPGDILRVTVYGHEDLSGEFAIGAAGTIPVPLVGEIQAAGYSVQELKDAITNALVPDYLKNPRVGVDVLNYRPFYIIGEVKQPGSYAYVSGMRVVNAIALAGGFTYRADEDDITISRGGNASEGAPADANATVLPGDVITVPERFF
jgi:polysaccharide export outer membrane protein